MAGVGISKFISRVPTLVVHQRPHGIRVAVTDEFRPTIELAVVEMPFIPSPLTPLSIWPC